MFYKHYRFHGCILKAFKKKKRNADGSWSNQIVISLFLAGGQKKNYGGEGGCQGMTCGNMPKITEYLPPQIIKIIYFM